MMTTTIAAVSPADSWMKLIAILNAQNPPSSTRQSINLDISRDARPATSKSRSTASGVTMPRDGERCVAATIQYRTRCVDIDRYMALNENTWRELDALVDHAGTMGSRLSPPEVERLLQLYQRASAHLSYVHTNFNDPALSARLSRTVGSASAVIYSTPARAGRAIGRFFSRTFPAAVWHARRFVVISALLMFLPALAVGAWLSNSDHARDVAISPELQQAYLEEDFENYYSSEAAAAFSTKVMVNNIQVSFLAFVGGIAFCLPTAYLLIFNGANVGVAAGPLP
jgi:hypothetical protein